MRPLILVTSLALACSGCAGFRGPTWTLDKEGPASLSPSYSVSGVPTGHPGVVGLFEISYAAAWSDQEAISAGRKVAPTSDTDAVSLKARQMAIDGISLIDSNCNDFFDSAGTNQKWLYFAKDLTAVVGSVATSILAIASPANATATAAVALSTGAAYNSADLYTRNFLFGADNVDSVRQLTKAVLVKHETEVLPTNDISVWSFAGAVQVINQHQDLCTVASIKSAVLDAIKGGTVQAYQLSGSALASPSAAAASAIPAATAAANTAVPGSPVTASAAANAAAAAAPAAAAAASAAPGATPASVVAAVTSATTSAGKNASIAAGAAPDVAAMQAAAASGIVAPAAAAATLPSAAPASRQVNIQVSGQPPIP